jgi:methylmalonyl-CoA mutase
MIAAFRKSGAKLACLCSSDAVYASEAVAAAQALVAAGARLILAGRPGEQEQALRAAGIQTFIFAGCNAIAALQATYDLIAS